jgi:hypothetical protein
MRAFYRLPTENWSDSLARSMRVALILFCALVLCPTAGAATLPSQSLTAPDQVLRWHGAPKGPSGTGYDPPVEQSCTTDTCDSFLLKVNVPAGTFPEGPRAVGPDGTTRIQATGVGDLPGDGILVSIKWATDFDQFNIYVDDATTGETVASGLDVDSNAQSVLLPQPKNGTYRVTVVPFLSGVEPADASYDGEVRVFHDPLQRMPAGTRPLPQIETVAPANFHVSDIPPVPSNPTGWRYTPAGTFPGNSCYTDETLQFGATKCLRFDNDIRNIGAGPLILRFSYAPDAFINNCKMQQEIIAGDGTVADRDAGPCIFHPQHAHFHYQNMGTYELYSVDGSLRPGTQPIARSAKVGFCTIDVDDMTWGTAASRPRTYSFPTCNVPNAVTAGIPTLGPFGPGYPPEYMGISPGWGDIYTWDLPQQYIDISKVPDGVYEVVSRSNPDGALLTADRSRETGVSCIRLQGTKVTTLYAFASQSNTAPLPACAPPVPAHAAKKKHRRHARRGPRAEPNGHTRRRTGPHRRPAGRRHGARAAT